MMKKLAGMLCLCAALFCASFAQADLTQAEKDELAQLKKKVAVTDDRVENRKIYSLPQLWNDGFMEIEFEQQNEYDSLWLFIGCYFSFQNGRFRPTGLDDSDLSAFVINVDGEIYRGKIPPENLKKSVFGTSSRQYTSINLNDPEMYNLVKKIAQSKEAVVRLKSRDGAADSVVSREKKQSIAALLRIYELEKKQKDAGFAQGTLALVDLAQDVLTQTALTQAEKNEFVQLMRKVGFIDDPEKHQRTYLPVQPINDGYLRMGVFKDDKALVPFLTIGYSVDRNADGARQRPEESLGTLAAYEINVDGTVFKDTIPIEEVTVDVDQDSVENSFFIDLDNNPEMYNLVKKIAQSKKTAVRLKTDKASADSVVSQEKKQAIAALLRIYELEKKQKDAALTQTPLAQAGENEFAQLTKKVRVVVDSGGARRVFSVSLPMNDVSLTLSCVEFAGILMPPTLTIYYAIHDRDGAAAKDRPDSSIGALTGYVLNIDGKVSRNFFSLETKPEINGLKIDYGQPFFLVDGLFEDLVTRIVQSKKTVVRLIGTKGAVESVISEKKKQEIAALLRIYELGKKQKATLEK